MLEVLLSNLCMLEDQLHQAHKTLTHCTAWAKDFGFRNSIRVPACMQCYPLLIIVLDQNLQQATFPAQTLKITAAVLSSNSLGAAGTGRKIPVAGLQTTALNLNQIKNIRSFYLKVRFLQYADRIHLGLFQWVSNKQGYPF